jgi:hypothetical protein
VFIYDNKKESSFSFEDNDELFSAGVIIFSGLLSNFKKYSKAICLSVCKGLVTT